MNRICLLAVILVTDKCIALILFYFILLFSYCLHPCPSLINIYVKYVMDVPTICSLSAYFATYVSLKKDYTVWFHCVY